jgi:hypothetical protein
MMTTIKITIDNRKNAQLLTKMLKSMAFVKKIEEDLPVSPNSNQFLLLKNLFESIEPNSIFRDITNPVEWEKNIRDEWEAR